MGLYMFKKLGLLLIVSLIMQAQANSFEKLPAELKLLILSQAVNYKSLPEAVKSIQFLKLINRDTNILIQDTSILKAIQQKFGGSEEDIQALRQRELKLKIVKAEHMLGFLSEQLTQNYTLKISIDGQGDTIILAGKKIEDILEISNYIIFIDALAINWKS